MKKTHSGVPEVGLYATRLAALERLLAPAIGAAFGIKGPAHRSEGRSKWNRGTVRWDLPERVSIGIHDHGYSADPEIWVHRNDPITPSGRPPEHTWGAKSFGRDYKSKTYDKAIEVSIVTAAQCVEDNRSMRLGHEVNQKAQAEELGDLKLAQGLHLERDPKTGLYTASISIKFEDIRPTAVRGLAETVVGMHRLVKFEQELKR